MRKRVMSLLLAAAMALSSVPAVGAVGSFEFMKEVQNALPAAAGTFIGDTPALPAVGGTGFLKKLSGDLPAVRKDGFLAEPTAPLRTFPGTGELLAEISAPDENAVEIDSADELAQVISGGSYVLTADIDLSEVDWEPQSQSSGSPKDITLDGQGHTISGLTGSADQYSSGLFGIVYGNLTARNLILRDFSFERGPVSGRSPRAGALAAWADKGLTLENCVLDGFSLTASDTGVSLESVGGFIGYAYGGSNCVLRDCAVRGTIDLSAGEDASLYCKFAGGMIGSLGCRGIQMTDCLSEMDMNFGACPVSYPGGLIGEIENQGTTDFLRCVSSGDVSGDALDSFSGFAKIRDPYMSYKPVTFTDCLYDGSCIVETDESGDLYFGGFVGELTSRSITLDNCRFEGEIDAGMECAGGLIGYVQDMDEKTVIRNCLADGVIRTGGSRAGGLVGMLSNTFTMEGCLASGTLTMDEGDKLSTSMGGLIGDCYGRNSPVVRCVNEGDVTARFAGGLVGNISDSGLYQPVLFTDCKNTGTITGEYQTTSTSGGQYSAAGGLFGRGIGSFTNCVAGGTVTGDRAGGLLGEVREYLEQQSESVFTDCRAACTLGGGITGGLLGAIDEDGGGSYATFTNCASNAALITDESADQVFGGLMGEGQGDMERCRAELDLTHTGTQQLIAGGLLGRSIGELVIWDCETEFAVEDRNPESSTLGGILGTGGGYDGMITNCVSTVAFETEAPATAGGIAGNFSGIMTRCTAVGTITADGGDLGGLCGMSEATVGECCASVDLHVPALDSDIANSAQMGGLIGGGGAANTVYSCWSDAELTYDANEAGDLGGLIGESGSLAMQDCCFLGSIGENLGENCGGIVGYVAFGSLIRNCYVQADISGSGQDLDGYENRILSQVGGIAGCVGGTIRDCYFKGSVENQGDTVGGIVGHDSYDTSLAIENCEVTGTVTGRIAGGIAGVTGGTVRDCTFDGQVRIDSVDEDEELGDDHILGGIAAEATGTIIGCEVKQPQRISKSFTLNGGSVFYTPTVRFGGIAANHTGEIADCVTQGASVIVTNASSLAVGGITAYGKQIHPVNVSYTEDIYYMDNCTVNGNVTASLTGHFPEELLSSEVVQVGGILGGAYKTAKLGGCTMNGSVTGTLNRSHDEMKYSLTAGGLAGSVQHLHLDASEFTGVLVYSPGLGNDGQYLPLLGDGMIEGASAPEVELPEREEEDYKIIVYGYTMQNLDGYLLEGAAVTVDGTGLGQTDALGEFAFSSDKLNKTGLSTITVSHDEYFESSHSSFLASEGEQTFWLKKKEPGQIYFKTVQYQEQTVHNLINRLDSVVLLQQDTDPKHVKIEVDWNDIDEEGRTVYLINETGNKKYNLEDNSVNLIRFTEVFSPGEAIYIVAKGTYEGKTVEAREKLALTIRQIQIKLPVEKGKQQVGANGEEDEDTNLYFLQGLNLDMGFGSMVPFATDISVLNEQLKVQFTWKSGDTDQIDVWKTGTMSHGVDVFVEGTLKVPITETMDGEWSGDVTFGINQMPEMNFDETVTIKGSLVDLDYPGVIKIEYPLPLPVPSYFETQIGVGGSGSLEFYGPFNKVNVKGKVTATGYGLIGVGMGGKLSDNLEAKVGGEGELRPEISMVHDPNAASPLTFDPSIKGAVSAKATLKAYIIGGEIKLKLGQFEWDKEKLVWSALGMDGEVDMTAVSAIGEEDFGSDWQAVPRGYLENGGGFRAQDPSLWGFSTASGAKVRYENIAETADTAMTVNDAGNVVLYYTADDETSGTAGTVAEHTVLWMTERAEDGSWSKPRQISTEGTYPALPHASGDYVVWVESAETGSLDGMLTSTVIKLAKNGTVVATYDPDCYVYDPQVAASGNNGAAVVGWMQDAAVTSENILGGSQKLYYAEYDGSALGRPSSMSDAHKATLGYDYTYRVYRYCHESGSLRQGWNDILQADLHRYATDGSITANFDEDGTLTIYSGSTAVKSLETSFNQSSVPVLASDPTGEKKYLFWAETAGIRFMTGSGSDWSEPLLLTATNAPAAQLAAAVDPDGIPHISWLESAMDEDAVRTDLYTMTLDPDGIDLVLQQISYDEAHLLDTGELKLEGIVFNNGMTAADGIQVDITDETGRTVYTNTFDRSVAAGGSSRFYAVFAPDGVSAHTYTAHITPVAADAAAVDADDSDNALHVSIAEGRGEIVQLGFVHTSTAKDVTLQALVRNTGGTAVDKMIVTITDESGAMIAEETFADVPGGSTRQLMATALPNALYTITVTSDGAETDLQTQRYIDPDAPRLTASAPVIAADTAAMELTGQGQTEGSCRVLLALYQNDKMRYIAEDTVPSLNGRAELALAFDKAPAAGDYNYKVFFLDDSTSAPLAAAKSGKLTVN